MAGGYGLRHGRHPRCLGDSLASAVFSHHTGKHWTRGHWAWVAGLTWEHEAEQQVVDDYLLAIDHLDTRLQVSSSRRLVQEKVFRRVQVAGGEAGRGGSLGRRRGAAT